MRSLGPGLDWSSRVNRLAIADRDSNGVIQVYTLQPDGGDVRCLTCSGVAGGPSANVHKGVPHWHPSGNYLFVQVERENHGGNRLFAEPGSGRWNEIWATTPTGDRWWRLTDASNTESGVLFPVPSRDGSRLAFAERVRGPRNPLAALLSIAAGTPIKDIWGQWRLSIGDIVIDSFQNVNLTGIQSFNPGGISNADDANPSQGASFYEMQEWSRDDSAIYFAADIGRSHPQVLDVWRYDLRTQELKPITSTNDHWEEHIGISPSGQRLTLMSSECCTWNPGDVRTLVAELYLIDPNGGAKTKVTNFNTPGAPEHTPGLRITVAKAVWSPDGRQIAFARQAASADRLSDPRTTELWMLTFQGACGA